MNIFKLHIVLFLSIVSINVNAQIVVNDLQELVPYLSQDNVDVKLTSGTYTISEQEILDRVYGTYETIETKTCYTIFRFTGNGSTYDFTDVTINIETAVFKSVGNYTLWEIRVAGNDITLKNLTLVDVGSKDDAPKKTANNIVMDGKNNVVEGFHVRSTGSYPYGYGDIFGKGGGPIISHRKHSAILIRGENNTLRNTNLIHKAYGHCVFFQAASNPMVEGCYIEGEVRTSDDMLTEEGTGTIGDQKGFITVWEYKLPPGFMVALCEAGIRAYNAGVTIVDEDTISRGTSNVTVKNTTVKNTRTACTLVHASGTQYIENITSIGNENGFSIGKGQVVNCRSDAAYGSAYSGENGVTGDVTIIVPENGYYNGTNGLVNITGGTVTLRTEETDFPADLFIQMGTFRSFRHQPGSKLMYQLDTIFSGATVYNHTPATVELGAGASNNDIHTCDEVIDNGSGNTVNELDDCELETPCNITPTHIEAECYSDMSGIQTEDCSEGTLNVGWINDGDWLMYEDIDLSGMNSIKARVSGKTTGSIIEIHIDAIDGDLIAEIPVTNTSGNQNWITDSIGINSVTETHDVYLVFKGETGYLFNINYFGFSEDQAIVTDIGAFDLLSNTLITSPNPVRDSFSILNQEGGQAVLIDQFGKEVLQRNISNNTYTIGTNELESGVYYLTVINNGKILTSKLMRI